MQFQDTVNKSAQKKTMDAKNSIKLYYTVSNIVV